MTIFQIAASLYILKTCLTLWNVDTVRELCIKAKLKFIKKKYKVGDTFNKDGKRYILYEPYDYHHIYKHSWSFYEQKSAQGILSNSIIGSSYGYSNSNDNIIFECDIPPATALEKILE